MIRHYILSSYHERYYNDLEDELHFKANDEYHHHIHMYLHNWSMYEKYRKGELK